jgi:hypothetical protein
MTKRITPRKAGSNSVDWLHEPLPITRNARVTISDLSAAECCEAALALRNHAEAGEFKTLLHPFRKMTDESLDEEQDNETHAERWSCIQDKLNSLAGHFIELALVADNQDIREQGDGSLTDLEDALEFSL